MWWILTFNGCRCKGLPSGSKAELSRCNGSYSRHLLNDLGDLELSVPWRLSFGPRVILRKFARRGFPVERFIMLAFIFGLSNRKAGQALLPILGEKVSPTTVNRIAQQLVESRI